MIPLPAELRPDCAACSALCCVAPPFDASQGFGYDKPAHTACRNLRPDCRCAIHEQLLQRGFPGCVNYDCFGAGQRVMREFADGQDWRGAPEQASTLFATFERLKPLHELRALVHYALQRAESQPARDELLDLQQEIEALCGQASSDLIRTAAQKLRIRTLERLRAIITRPTAA